MPRSTWSSSLRKRGRRAAGLAQCVSSTSTGATIRNVKVRCRGCKCVAARSATPSRQTRSWCVDSHAEAPSGTAWPSRCAKGSFAFWTR
eukprot:6212849-Pyramimonas_sp.AAC.1